MMNNSWVWQGEAVKMGKMKALKHWFVIYVKSHHEKAVERALSQSGYDCFLPLKKSLKRYCDRMKWVEEPLFPNYIFVRNTIQDQIRILQQPSVFSFVCCGGLPSVVRDDVIMTIRHLIRSGVKYEVSRMDFVEGERVILSTGILAGMTGEIVEVIGQKKVRIRIDQLGQSMLLTVDDLNQLQHYSEQ